MLQVGFQSCFTSLQLPAALVMFFPSRQCCSRYTQVLVTGGYKLKENSPTALAIKAISVPVCTLTALNYTVQMTQQLSYPH